jgi:hypothetical protein
VLKYHPLLHKYSPPKALKMKKRKQTTKSTVSNTPLKKTKSDETHPEHTTLSYWLMKAEPESRIVKGKDVKVIFHTSPNRSNSLALTIFKPYLGAHGMESVTMKHATLCAIL